MQIKTFASGHDAVTGTRFILTPETNKRKINIETVIFKTLDIT
jgi:hypothetical protein